MNWNNYVKNLMAEYSWKTYEPGAVVRWYHETKKELANLEKKLKNPIKRKTGERLKPSTIKQLEHRRRDLISQERSYKRLIKQLVKFNLLPTSKLISGEDRQQFVFTLITMLTLPELGKVTYWANRLTDAQYNASFPATNDDYEREHYRYKHAKKREEGERSREDLYDSLIAALNETMRRLISERWKFIHPDKKQPRQRLRETDEAAERTKRTPSKVFILKRTETEENEDQERADRTNAFDAGDKYLSSEFKNFLEQKRGENDTPPLS